jgi:rubrerythrin
MIRKTTQEFIEQDLYVHGDEFDYFEVEYVNTHTSVKTRCNQCGIVFQQEPSSHLVDRGCPICSKKQTHKLVNQDMFIARARMFRGHKLRVKTNE